MERSIPEGLTQSREGAKGFRESVRATSRYAHTSMSPNEAARLIVDAAYHIHSTLGPGLLESVYQAILVHALRKRGLRVEVEVPIPVYWDDIVLDIGFRADLIVEDVVIVELKSAERVTKAHSKQLLTYLRVTDKRLGLLINFGAALIKDGITRVANRLAEPPASDSMQ